MTEEINKKGNSIGQDDLKAWVASLRLVNEDAVDISSQLADWICAGWLSAAIAPDYFPILWQERQPLAQSTSVSSLDLVIAGLCLNRKAQQNDLISQLATFHLGVAKQMDKEETGLLNCHLIGSTDTYLPSVQAAWIWSAYHLLQTGRKESDDLIEMHELYLHEIDQQLWSEDNHYYREKSEPAQDDAFILHHNALTLLAHVPDQERAEELLQWLVKNTPPWQTPQTAVEDWLGAAAFLLYQAMQSYDMEQEANELRQYALTHLTGAPTGPQQKCLYWLWHNKS